MFRFSCYLPGSSQDFHFSIPAQLSVHPSVAALLSQRNLDEAAKAAGVAPNTLLNWIKDREFAAAYRKARWAVVGQAIARLQQTTGAPPKKKRKKGKTLRSR
jgi:hypothetical protein